MKRCFLLALLVCFLVTETSFAQARQGMGKPGSNQKKKPDTGKIPRGDKSPRLPKVKPVQAGNIQHIRDVANRIDKLIAEEYRKHSIDPNPNLDDSLFLRRAYLEIGGRIPTLEEVGAFVQNRSPQKRSQLIDSLLQSPDYVSHMYNYWADLLRLQDHPINNNQLAESYHEWIKDSIRQNTPYNKWVHTMLTAEGRIWENPAVGYVMRDSNMELDAVDNMVQVWLGTQIGCAQCHDHPFDKWTQKQYYEMAAYWFGTRTRMGAGDKRKFPNGNPVTRIRSELKAKDPEANTGGIFGRMINANMFSVYEQKRPLKLPHDYQYDNGKPRQTVKFKPIFGEADSISNATSPREVLANWMTSDNNPRFAMNIVNRMWHKAFGMGLLEPVNDIRDESAPVNAGVLRILTEELVANDYDVREIQRIIYHTKTWQREATPFDPDLNEPYRFPGPVLRRMSAEQIWDSLLTLAVYNPNSWTRPSQDGLGDAIGLDLNTASADDVTKAMEAYNEKFSSGAERKITRQRNSYKGKTLARASELPTPLSPEHFLRQFGQSDRELIETSSREGSVSQILTMFNGEVTHMMLERGSLIYDTVLRAPSQKDKVNAVFYSILSRPPKPTERRVADKEIKTAGAAGYGNVIWALINTKEFLFIQ